MPFSDYTEANILNAILRGVTFPLPPTVYVALFTADPGDTGGGTEVSGGSYARVGVTANTSNWNAPSTGGLSDNVNAVTFPTATANWGTVTHVGLFDASSSGNLLVYGALSSSQAVNSGQTASFAAGALDVTAD